MIDFLIIILVVGILVLLGFALFKALSSSTRVVPQEERLVVYRLGKFHRVVGPGIVRIYPKLDEVRRVIEVRDHPVQVTVDGIFAFGVPNTLTLNLWVRSDPVEAARKDQATLGRLVQIKEHERQDQVEVKMRDALVKQVAELQQTMPLPDYANTFDGVIALAPGSARYNALLEGVTLKLQQTLPSIGVILNESQPITLTRRAIPDDIINALGQKRGIDISGQTLIQYAVQLKTAFPEMSDAILSQILGSIPGVDMSNVRPIIMEQIRAVETKLEYELHEDGTGQYNLQSELGPQKLIEGKSVTVQPPSGDDRLNDSDLAVLKQIPRNDPRQKTA